MAVVLDPDENQILEEKSVMVQNDARIENGILHITNKRILYEKIGERRLRRAEPSKIYIEIPMYEILNVSSAVPKMSLFTKKKLSIEYKKDGNRNVVEFEIKNPDPVVSRIEEWAKTAKLKYQQETRSKEEEEFRKKVELEKAKASKTNVNMINLGGTKQNSSGDYPKNVENEYSSMVPMEEPKCPECGAKITKENKFCPNCGLPLK
ncbi:zinc-ribbon domain-containing protein [Caldiplasma sukawensis]